jgi:hypothetical protein
MSVENKYIDAINKLIEHAGSDPERISYLLMTLNKGTAVLFLKADTNEHEHLFDICKENIQDYIDHLVEHHEEKATFVA